MLVTTVMRGPIAEICWNDGENRLDRPTLTSINATLDELDEIEGPLAIVFTGFGRFFCNGVDLESNGGAPEVIDGIVDEFKRTLGRLLVFRAFSVAAVNGHAFGAGAVLTCAFDYRTMREDRGYWCVNERELGIELDAGLLATLNHCLGPEMANDAVNTAHRYTGVEALERHIVDEVAPESAVLTRAIEVAKSYVDIDRDELGRQKRKTNLALANQLGFAG